jgi:hypothetical protein
MLGELTLLRRCLLGILIALGSEGVGYSQYPDAPSQKGLAQGDYYGEVVYKNGKAFQYNWLVTSGWGMEGIPYAKTLECHRHDVDGLPRFDLRNVARIDIVSEQRGFKLCGESLPETNEYANRNVWVYRAKVMFRSGDVLNDIYIYGSAWFWKRCSDKVTCDALSIAFDPTGTVKKNVGDVIGAKSITINIR